MHPGEWEGQPCNNSKISLASHSHSAVIYPSTAPPEAKRVVDSVSGLAILDARPRRRHGRTNSSSFVCVHSRIAHSGDVRITHSYGFVGQVLNRC